MAEQRLPPFPDDLVERRSLDEAIGFLIGLRLPSRFAAHHLRRYALTTGLEVRREHFERVRQVEPPRARE